MGVISVNEKRGHEFGRNQRALAGRKGKGRDNVIIISKNRNYKTYCWPCFSHPGPETTAKDSIFYSINCFLKKSIETSPFEWERNRKSVH